MTDPMYNPQTGHGVECLCDQCRLAMMERHILDGLPITDEFKNEWNALAERMADRVIYPRYSRVITRVMTDGISTKDGLS